MPPLCDQECGFTIGDTRGWHDVTTQADRERGRRFILRGPTQARMDIAVGPREWTPIEDYIKQIGGELRSHGTIQICGASESTYTYRVRQKIVKRYHIIRGGLWEVPSISLDPCELSIVAYPIDPARPLSAEEEKDADAIVSSITFQEPQHWFTAHPQPDGILQVRLSPQAENEPAPKNVPDLNVEVDEQTGIASVTMGPKKKSAQHDAGFPAESRQFDSGCVVIGLVLVAIGLFLWWWLK